MRTYAVQEKQSSIGRLCADPRFLWTLNILLQPVWGFLLGNSISYLAVVLVVNYDNELPQQVEPPTLHQVLANL